MSETYTEAVLTTLPRLAASLSLRRLGLNFYTVVCVLPAGCQPPSGPLLYCMSWSDLTVRYCFPTFNIAARCIAAFFGRVFLLTGQYLLLLGPSRRLPHGLCACHAFQFPYSLALGFPSLYFFILAISQRPTCQ